MTNDCEVIEDNLLAPKGGELCPDMLTDDLALVVDTDFGPVVILGCAHRGIVNMLRHAQKQTGKEMGIHRLGVSHCTGFRASARLAQEFEGFFLNNAGSRFTLP